MERRRLLRALAGGAAAVLGMVRLLKAEDTPSQPSPRYYSDGQGWWTGQQQFTMANGGVHVHQMVQTSYSLGTTTVNMDGEAQLNASAGVLVCSVCGVLKLDPTKLSNITPNSDSPVVSPQAGNEDAQ